MTKLPIDRSTY